MRSRSLMSGILVAVAASALADLKTMNVEYTSAGEPMLGFLAYDDSISGPRPAVMIVHDWDGLNDYEMSRAKQLAQMGYVAFAVDVYGRDNRPKTNEDNGRLAGKYRADVPLFRQRMRDGFEAMLKQPNVDPTKTAAIGYCFGGGGVLEAIRSGVPLVGAVTFHGALKTPMPATPGSAPKTKLLVCHAIQDPSVPWEDVTAFVTEMNAAKMDYQILTFNENVHPFTVPGPSFRPDADRRSWQAMKNLFAEIFGK